MGFLWEQLDMPRMIEVKVELVRVHSRDVGAVDWTEEEVRKRGGEVMTTIATLARPSQKEAVAKVFLGGSFVISSGRL